MVILHPGEHPSGQSIIKWRHPNGLETARTGQRGFQHGNILQMHVSIYDKLGKQRPGEQSGKVLRRACREAR